MMGTFVFADYADDISRQGDAYRPARAARVYRAAGLERRFRDIQAARYQHVSEEQRPRRPTRFG